MARVPIPLDPLRRFKTYVQVVKAAKRLFTGHISSVKFLASAPTIQSIPDYGSYPEVMMVGRANVGKSTLINYVCAQKQLAITSSTPGRTRALNFYCIRRVKKNLVALLVDSPGYGSRGRPEWGKVFEHYVRNRADFESRLRRVYILISAEHGVTEDDKAMLQFLERESQSRLKPFTVQAVLTKVDKVPRPLLPHVMQAHRRVISETSSTCMPAILTAVGRRRFGDIALRRSILYACGWTA